MSTYSVESSDTKTFLLQQADQPVGSLTYDSWFSFKATIQLVDGETFNVEPKGFWGTTIDIKAGETVLLEFTMNWKGQILLHDKASSNDRHFLIKQRSFLKSTFVLTTTDEEDLLVLEPNFKWNKLTYTYQLTTSDAFEQEEKKALLMLTAVHCANYYLTIMTAAAV